ncbi:MAG: condensation domain-containing protein, partial [Candidatus Parabeggiatoa sp.]|nr:condensation domain-containing protein [Candidatus Parabeggiatoa sp.]
MTKEQLHLYPLTSSQREIWFDQMLHAEVPLYNIGGYVKIPGQIDPALFEQAVNLLVQKHDALRTRLTETEDEDGLPFQSFQEELSNSVLVQDFSDQDDAKQAALTWMKTRFNEPFQLIGQPLFRYDLVKTSEECYYWLMQYHHIIADGYSVALLNRSLADIYTQVVNGQTPELNDASYVRFIEYDHDYAASEASAKNRQYWTNKYPTAPEPLLNLRYRSHFSDNVVGSDCEPLTLSYDFYQSLHTFAQSHHTTLFRVLLGALYVYFTRTAQRDDFTMGYATLNRPLEAFRHTAGLFTLVAPGYFQFGTDLSFADLLQKLHHSIKTDVAHPYSLTEINSPFTQGEQRTRLFDISISYQRFNYDSQFNGFNSQMTWLLHSWEQSPLMIYVQDFHAQSDVKLDFVYNLAYFTPAEIQALQNRLMTILQALLTNPFAPIRTLPILTEPEIEQLQAWNQTKTDYPKDKTVV